MVLHGLSALGVEIDSKLNNIAIHEEEKKISSTESQVQVFVIPTNEELMMALKAYQKIVGKKKQA